MSKLVPDLLALVGILLLAYGLWLVYPPLAYMIPGVLLMVYGLLLAQRQAGEEIKRAQ